MSRFLKSMFWCCASMFLILAIADRTAMATSGTACVADSASAQFLARTIWYGVQNQSADQNVTVFCPIENPSFQKHLHMIVYDRSTPDNVSCTLSMFGQDGNGLIFQQMASSSNGGPGSGSQQLDITIGTFWAYNSTLVCTIPHMESVWNSHVVSYWWTP